MPPELTIGADVRATGLVKVLAVGSSLLDRVARFAAGFAATILEGAAILPPPIIYNSSWPFLRPTASYA